MTAEAPDPIDPAKRILLFCRVPLGLGLALGLAQSSGLLAGRDAALLGASAAASQPGWPVAMVIVLVAALLPGAAIIWRGVERGLLLSIAGLSLYLLISVALAGQLDITLPIVAPIAGWYLSQVLGIGWRPHAHQDVRHILSVQQRRVFLSYRRALDDVTARMLKHELAARGFDVFLDLDNLGPEARFDQRLLKEIESRYNFVILLSPGSLARCHEEGDWVRCELEHALVTHRRVVPVTRAGFELGEARDLPASISSLPLHNAVEYVSTHHDAVLARLISFLSAPQRTG